MAASLKLFAVLALSCVCFLVHGFSAEDIPRACSTPSTSKYPFCDTSLDLESRVRDLLGRIPLEDKPLMLTARESPKGGVPSLGVPEYDWGANCIHGVQSRCLNATSEHPAVCPTSFPNPNGLGAMWNPDLVQKMDAVIGVELRALWLQGVAENHDDNLPHLGLDCWSPNININRDPRWGRALEVASEDPLLNGLFGEKYSVGLQRGADPRYLQAVVTLKHWDVYNLESYGNETRHTFDAQVSKFDLQDTYWPAFQRSVIKGGAKGVMCSYNEVNGVPACASKLLSHVLRDVWGFDGYVTSDSGAVEDIYSNKSHHFAHTAAQGVADAIKAGTDIDSSLDKGDHSTGSPYTWALLEALKEGLIEESDIDKALTNTLKLRFELGLFDPIHDQPYWHIPTSAINTNASQALNKQMTQETLVLLKNDNATLPFAKGQHIAVIGPHANAQQARVGNYIGQICPGPSRSDFTCVQSPADALRDSNVGGTVTAVEGCDVTCDDRSGFNAAVAAARVADSIVLALGLDVSTIEREGLDRVNISLPGYQLALAQEIIALGKPTAVVLINGGQVAVDWLAGHAPAVIEAFYPGVLGGSAISDVIVGDYNPGGKLPYTIYDEDYINQVSMYEMSMTAGPGRSYRYYTGRPLWPFGWGMSYTTFAIQWKARAPTPVFSTKARVVPTEIQVAVTNTGSVDGDEVVQFYVLPGDGDVSRSKPTTSSTTAPVALRRLVSFQRVSVAAGDTQHARLVLTASDLATVNEEGDRILTAGEYKLIACTDGCGDDFHSGDRLIMKAKVVGPTVVIDEFPRGY